MYLCIISPLSFNLVRDNVIKLNAVDLIDYTIVYGKFRITIIKICGKKIELWMWIETKKLSLKNDLKLHESSIEGMRLEQVEKYKYWGIVTNQQG